MHKKNNVGRVMFCPAALALAYLGRMPMLGLGTRQLKGPECREADVAIGGSTTDVAKWQTLIYDS